MKLAADVHRIAKVNRHVTITANEFDIKNERSRDCQHNQKRNAKARWFLVHERNVSTCSRKELRATCDRLTQKKAEYRLVYRRSETGGWQ